MPPDERFNLYIKENSNGCIEWTGSKRNSYGRFYVNGKVGSAHRYAWERVHGPIKDNLCVLHECDNPSCINVQHLFLGSQVDNIADMVKKGRHARLCGSANGNSKLSEENITKIRDLLKRGAVQNYLATEFNVTYQQISAIKTGKNWKHTFQPQTAIQFTLNLV